MATETKCPVLGGPHRHTAVGATANQHWWPNQLNLKILHQNSPKSDPMGNDFNYADEFKTLDLDALKKDIDARGVRVDFDISGRVLPDNPGQWRGDVADAVREPDGKCGGQRGSGDERDHDGACFLGGEIARRTMSVRSEEGSGTMVTIRLPRQQSAGAHPGACSARSHGRSRGRYRADRFLLPTAYLRAW